MNKNSIRNKYLISLQEQVAGNIDVVMILETKIHESFSVGKFLLPGFSVPYRSDRDSKGGRVLLYVREGIPSSFNYRKETHGRFLCRVKFAKKQVAFKFYEQPSVGIT